MIETKTNQPLSQPDSADSDWLLANRLTRWWYKKELTLYKSLAVIFHHGPHFTGGAEMQSLPARWSVPQDTVGDGRSPGKVWSWGRHWDNLEHMQGGVATQQHLNYRPGSWSHQSKDKVLRGTSLQAMSVASEYLCFVHACWTWRKAEPMWMVGCGAVQAHGCQWWAPLAPCEWKTSWR